MPHYKPFFNPPEVQKTFIICYKQGCQPLGEALRLPRITNDLQLPWRKWLWKGDSVTLYPSEVPPFLKPHPSEAPRLISRNLPNPELAILVPKAVVWDFFPPCNSKACLFLWNQVHSSLYQSLIISRLVANVYLVAFLRQ